MIFKKTGLNDAYIIELEEKRDSRGFFARGFCEDEFERNGLVNNFVQCNISFNNKKGTLRGMHYQVEPYEEVKIVRCTKGAIYDIIIDIRRKSHTFMQWVGVELTEENRRSLYVPKGFAHGYITLIDNSEVFYMVSEFYHPACERGIRWNDKQFNIRWPNVGEKIISEKDRDWDDFNA